MQMDDPSSGFERFTSVQYWDNAAKDWDREILNNLEEDRNRRSEALLRKYAGLLQKESSTSLDVDNTNGIQAVDFGCGVGKWLPYLSEVCGNVIGLDISPKACRIAKATCRKRGLTNVRVMIADLANCKLWRKGVHSASLVVCANVLISPDKAVREAILSQIQRTLRRRGILILVVPSVESNEIVTKRRLEWIERMKEKGKDYRAEKKKLKSGSSSDTKKGVFSICGVRTQHYRKAEIKTDLRKRGFKILEMEKVEYPWQGTIEEPTEWMRSPYPYDWVIVARRSGAATTLLP